MARSLNRAQLIGNLTRDPELRYTPSGAAVCSFGVATNRSWTTDTGEKHDEPEFHYIVAWNKLAEICSQFLTKGRKVFVEGRLATRKWTGKDGNERSTTEIVIDDMIILDNRGSVASAPPPVVAREVEDEAPAAKPARKTSVSTATSVDAGAKRDEPKEEAAPEEVKSVTTSDDEVAPDDIPF